METFAGTLLSIGKLTPVLVELTWVPTAFCHQSADASSFGPQLPYEVISARRIQPLALGSQGTATMSRHVCYPFPQSIQRQGPAWHLHGSMISESFLSFNRCTTDCCTFFQQICQALSEKDVRRQICPGASLLASGSINASDAV